MFVGWGRQVSAHSEQTHWGPQTVTRRATLHVLVFRGCPCMASLTAREGECEESSVLFRQRKLTLAGQEALDGVHSPEQ